MRIRLVAAFIGLVLMLVVVQDFPLATYLRGVEQTQIITAFERDAWKLASQNDTAIAYDYHDVLDANTVKYAQSTGATVLVTDSAGIVIASSLYEELGQDYSLRPEVALGLLGKSSSGSRMSERLGEPMIYVSVPVESRGALVGVVRISYPQSEIDTVVVNRIQGIVVVGFLTLVLAIIAALAIANAFTRRIRRLQAATTELAAGDLSVRVGDPHSLGAPELRQLENAFDKMVERLSAVLESQRSFASDASHQLRTPLTALRLQLENAAERVDDPALTAERLEAAQGEVVRLQTLVDGLMTLARIEGHAGERELIDVSELVRDRLEMWQSLADEKGVRIHAEIGPGLQVRAAVGYLDQIIDAYLDNALDFAPEGSDLVVTATAAADTVEVHVIDEGPGMTPEQRVRAFDRFWRGRADGSGTGLGLAIVSRIAAALGAEVGLEESPAGGVDAYLRIARA